MIARGTYKGFYYEVEYDWMVTEQAVIFKDNKVVSRNYWSLTNNVTLDYLVSRTMKNIDEIISLKGGVQ